MLHEDIPHHIPDEYFAVWNQKSKDELFDVLYRLTASSEIASNEDSRQRQRSIITDLENFIRYKFGDEASSDLDVFV